MAEGPMPDDFGTQLSTYMSKPGPTRSTASDTQPEVPLSDKQRRDIAMKAAKERWSNIRGTSASKRADWAAIRVQLSGPPGPPYVRADSSSADWAAIAFLP